MSKIYMAIDQYGNIYRGLKHPRKDLCERLYRSYGSARKMYIDDKEGKIYHCGYIIAGLWLTIYEVKEMRIKQN